MIPDVSADRYRVAPFVRFPLLHGSELVYFPLSGQQHVLTKLEVDALSICTDMLTLQEHSCRVSREIILAPNPEEALNMLCRLQASGAFVSLAELMHAANGSGEDRRQISWLAIPTCDRRSQLERAITTYANNAREFDRAYNILVSSDGLETSDWAVRDAAAVVNNCGLPLYYAGPSHKLSFSRSVAAAGDIPFEIVSAALLGVDGTTISTGANRNTILLHTIGSLILSVDDDTVCCPGTMSPDSDARRLHFSGHSDPREVWCFESRAEALAYLSPASLDIVGSHEKCLGAQLPTLLAGRLSEADLGIDSACFHMIDSLSRGTGRVVSTFNGIAGDSGFHSSLGIVSHSSVSTRERVMLSEEAYYNLTQSRAVICQAPATTICHAGSGSMTTCAGFDNREMIPPFMPNYRNQDGVYAAVVSACLPDSYFAHLPFVLAHDPPDQREYASTADYRARVSDVVIACVTTWHPSPALNGICDRLQSLGTYLMSLASLPRDEFDTLIRTALLMKASATIRSLESMIDRFSHYHPPFWMTDIDTRIKGICSAVDEGSYTLPSDSSGPPSVTQHLQTVIKRYGEILHWWPAIVQTAQTLSLRGIRVAEQLAA